MRRAVLALVAACGGTQATEPHKAADLTKYLPATLEADKAKQGEARTAHVRVWADAEVRALPHWKEDITEQLDYASQLLTPLVGVKLVADDFKDWTREGDVHGAAKALAEADDGKDVTWVIGYVAPAETATDSMSDLGESALLGHHVVVRAWAEKAETEKLAPALASLSTAERAEVASAHKRHKQTVVLLHYLAQTLGAITEADPAWIQNPAYSKKQASFSDRNRELIQLAIDERLSGGTDATLAHDLLENIEKQDWGGWVATDHDQTVAVLRNVVESAKSGKTAVDVPAAAYEEFDRIREMKKRGESEAALRELDNLLIAYPANATMYELKCEIMIDKPGVADKATRAACTRVAELAPGDPTVYFTVGEALAKAGDLKGARAQLDLAASRIVNLPVGQDDAWRRLVAVYVGMGALTWTEEAIAAGKLDKDPAAAEVAQTRARYGVPRGLKGLKPEQEAALVAAVKSALGLVYAGKYSDAERAIAASEKKWPDAPGLEAARCDLELRVGRMDAAKAACARALQLDANESWALYLSGLLALRDTSAAATKAGIEWLKKAIGADPELAQAWRALGKAYQRAKDEKALQELGAEYQAKFGQALPL
jgi:predicted Zn-dependent protease